MTPDTINAVFEFGGACLLLLNVRRLWLDKRLAGVAIAPTAWYSLWGAWNLYYYFHLNQIASWVAGMLVVVMNSGWVALAIRYRKGDA